MDKLEIRNGVLEKYFGDEEHISVPEGITGIGDSAFRSCNSLRGITLPDSLRVIEKAAFQNCSALETITIPYWVEKIEQYAFSGCGNLRRVEFAERPVAVYLADDYYNILFESKDRKINHALRKAADSNPKTKQFTSYRNMHYVILAGKLQPKESCSVSAYAFDACKNLRHILLPRDHVRFDQDAFRNCEYMEPLDLPRKVGETGYGGFYLTFSSAEEASQAKELLISVMEEEIPPVSWKNLSSAPWLRIWQEGAVLYIFGCVSMRFMEYAHEKTDTGGSLFQRMSLTLARTWPCTQFQGRSAYYNPASGMEHGFIVEFRDKTLCFHSMWAVSPELCGESRERFDYRTMPKARPARWIEDWKYNLSDLEEGESRLRWMYLAACTPTKNCRESKECNVYADRQVWKLNSGVPVLVTSESLHEGFIK